MPAFEAAYIVRRTVINPVLRERVRGNCCEECQWRARTRYRSHTGRWITDDYDWVFFINALAVAMQSVEVIHPGRSRRSGHRSSKFKASFGEIA